MSSGYIYRVENRAIVYQHREVLFDHIGLGPHLCEYCGCHVNWRMGNNRSSRTDRTWKGVLVVDHRDGDKGNNLLANLAIACQPCNLRLARAYRPSALRSH
jgi:hypothetical protein